MENGGNAIVQNYGLEWVDGIVAENNAQYYYSGNPFYLLPDINSTAYTSSITDAYVLAAYSIGITYPEDEETIAYESLLIAFVMVVVLPLLLLGYGIFVWYVRRRK